MFFEYKCTRGSDGGVRTPFSNEALRAAGRPLAAATQPRVLQEAIVRLEMTSANGSSRSAALRPFVGNV